jgi:hypothetical protein
MIKDVEIAMVNAANYALEYKDKNYTADVAEIIKQFMKSSAYLNMKPGLSIYSVAAISEIMKLKSCKESKSKSNRQIMQMFVNTIPEFSKRIQEENSE